MTPWVLRLLVVNVLVYFVQQAAPGVTSLLAFVPAYVLVRPWTMITYMFAHASLTHILFNMLALYFFGPRVEQRMGSGNFFSLYMISGIAGAMLSFAFAPFAPIVGASGALFGVMLAFARFWPRDQILIWGIVPVQARFLVLGYTLWSVFSGFSGSRGGVADFAHLGGFVGGFLYLLFLERMQGARKFKRQVTAGVPADALAGSWRKVDPAGIHAVNRDEVNRILDKINASGIGSLTPQERTFLSNFVPPDDRPKKPLPS